MLFIYLLCLFRSREKCNRCYTIEIDETNKKNDQWYINTNITYSLTHGGKVKATYGTDLAKLRLQTLYIQKHDKSNGDILTGKDVGDVRNRD